jgi:4-hydroxybenzoate polyprenyltransferase
MTTDERQATASLLDYLRLFRLPNVFTALADVAMGYACAHASFEPVGPLVCLLGASALLYTAGMVLNDVYDAEIDARERPWRPVASGRISIRTARNLGFTLLLVGVAVGAAAGLLPNTSASPGWRSSAVAGLLALSILLYDGVAKSTWAGPLVMGSCRFLNVLLGASLGVLATDGWTSAGFQPHQLVAAGGIGIYVVGLTWFARREAGESQVWQLSLATLVILSGIGTLAFMHRYLPAAVLPGVGSEFRWYLLLALLGFTIVRRCLVAMTDPGPRQVQLAVRHGILSIIVLDAAVTLAMTFQVGGWYHAVGVLSLLIPTLILGRWAYST